MGATTRPPALPGPWNGLVVFCGGTAWDGNRLPDQHIAGRLTRWAPVLYVDPPISLLTPLRRPEASASLRAPRLRLVGPRLARLTPVVLPGPGRPLIRRTTTPLTRRAMRRAVAALGCPRVHATVVASLDGLFDVCGEQHRVLYATDDFVAGARLMNLGARRLEREERDRLAEAEIVVACSAELADRWRALGKEPVLVPNGVDAALFETADEVPPAADVRLPAPIAGFVGHLSDRIDLGLLEAVADAGHSLLLVGPRATLLQPERLERLLARPNVQWTGARPFESLPSYIRHIKVGLLPYGDTPFNRASFPLKTLEYLAAGRPAVVTDLPAVRWLGTELVDIATTPADFAAAVGRALAAPPSDELARRRRAVAAQNTWDRRAEAFAAAIGIRDRDA